MLCQRYGKSVESRQPRWREDARANCPHQCCCDQGECNFRQRQFHHAVDANHTVEVWKITNTYNGSRQGKTNCGIKASEAREIQLEVRVGAKRECLPKLGARLKHGRIDDHAEDERNEEVLRDCLFPQYYANPGASLLMRRTEREVRRDSSDKVHMVLTEGDDVHVLCAIVSFKAAKRRVVQTSSRVMCDSCGRSVSEVQGCLFSFSLDSRNSSENSSFSLDA